MAGIQDKNYYYDVEQDFVPSGAAVTQVWDEIANSACNTCHNPLSAHGGSRYDVKLCVLCHSPQTVDPDTGNTVDFKVMVHKIHMGEQLPSVLRRHSVRVHRPRRDHRFFRGRLPAGHSQLRDVPRPAGDTGVHLVHLPGSRRLRVLP